MNINFTSIAPYLKDPLVLIGFCVFLAFMFARALVNKGIIPQLEQGQGFSILKLILHYGFILGIAIILLGFGLRYQTLSENEQKATIGLLTSELEHNVYVVSELKKNTKSFSDAVNTVSTIIRRNDFMINNGLFPDINIDPNSEQDPDLYNKRMSWFISSGLQNNENALRRFREQNAAIVRTVNKTKRTIDSLADQKGKRYLIERKAFDANLDIIRKIDIVNTSDLTNLYLKTQESREKYYRIASITVEYLDAIREYCTHDTPDQASLGAVLAVERLTVRLLPKYTQELDNIIKNIEKNAKRLSI